MEGDENMEKAMAFVLIRTKPGHENAVYYTLAKRGEFNELHPVTGEYSMVAKVVTNDPERIGYIVRDAISKTEHVDSYETLIVTPL